MNKLDVFCFTSVARTKNFSLTAKELRISQQAVSKHIKNMEEELGFPLFFRSTEIIELTRAGEYMLKYFFRRSKIIEDIRHRFMDPGKQSITMACSQWTGCPSWLTSAVQMFQAEHKDSIIHMLDLDAGETAQAVENKQIDFLITTSYSSKLLPSEWEILPLTRLPLYLISCKNMPAAREHLHLYPFYAPAAGEKQEAAIQMRVKNTCSRHIGFIPQKIHVCRDMGSVMLNVLLNQGITLGCYIPDAQTTPDYHYELLKYGADLVLCYPPYLEDFLPRLFSSVLMEAVNHE